VVDPISLAKTKLIGKALDAIFAGVSDTLSSAGTRWRNEQAKSRLASKVSSVQKVKTFWQRDKPVDLASFYYPSKIIYGNAAPRRIDSIADVTLDENLVFQGTVGQGKSTLLRFLCMQELTNKGSGRIPVFVELRSLGKAGLRALLYSALDRLGFAINDELFDLYARSGKLVLLLDAFDEIQSEFVPDSIYQLEELSEKYEQCQIIVTSRPDSDIQKSRHFVVTRLAPMTEEDHAPFLTRIGLSRTEAGRLVEAIQNSNARVAELLTTPLVITLLATLYNAERSIPEDVPEFYERLFHTLFTTHDATKPGLVRKPKSHLGERRMQHLFEALCFVVLQRDLSVVLTLTDFNTSLDVASRATKIECDADEFRHDITKIACLLQQEGNELEFIHKSVLEFHAAAFIRSLSDATAPTIYKQLLQHGQHAFTQVIEFLSQIDEYRYVRYYGLPLINSDLRILTGDPDGSAARDLKAVFGDLFPEFMVSFEEDEHSEFLRFSSMGPCDVRPYIGSLGFQLTDAIDDSLPDTLPKEIALRAKMKKSSGNELEANWYDVVDEKRWRLLEKHVATLVTQLRRKKKHFEDLLASDQEQIHLISLPTPTEGES
jgi:NACHT domain